MPRTTPPYAPDFKIEAVRLARRGDRSVRETATDLGTSYDTLRHWLKQTQLDAGERHDGLTSEELGEFYRLRRENRRLRKEERAHRPSASAQNDGTCPRMVSTDCGR